MTRLGNKQRHEVSATHLTILLHSDGASLRVHVGASNLTLNAPSRSGSSVSAHFLCFESAIRNVANPSQPLQRQGRRAADGSAVSLMRNGHALGMMLRSSQSNVLERRVLSSAFNGKGPPMFWCKKQQSFPGLHRYDSYALISQMAPKSRRHPLSLSYLQPRNARWS